MNIKVGDWVTLNWCNGVIGPREVKEIDEMLGRLIVKPGLNIRFEDVVEVRSKQVSP